jgi:hypothetical protein
MVFVVERYLPGLSRSDLPKGSSRIEQTAAEHGTVRYPGSTIVLEGEARFGPPPSHARVKEPR